jgi:hypothetical protein
MGELQLTEQDVDLLITALEVLLQRVEGREDSATLQSSIHSMQACLQEMHGEGRAQALAAIQQALSEIASELASNNFYKNESDQA